MPASIRHYENREELLELLTEPGRYPLEVSDDSMAAAGIYRGDTVVVQSQQHARDGDIVVALIDNEEVALTRVRLPRPDRIELLAAYPAAASRVLERSRVAIQGKVIGRFRRYR